MIDRRNRGQAPVWDAILRTGHWDVVHAVDTSVLGWTILVLRRHVEAVAELTDAEAAELGLLTRDVSRLISPLTGCAKTYVAQFAEHPRHPHVHVHVVPRAADLAPDRVGPAIFAELAAPAERRVDEASREHFAIQLRQQLQSLAPWAG